MLLSIQLATPDRPLVFLLDALDQLSVDHRAHLLAWLPTALPPNVFFVVSTVTDHPTFHGLAAVSIAAEGGTGQSGFVEVPALGRSLALSLVREWLKSAGRSLTSSQLMIVGDAFSACSLPLYITLVFDEVDLDLLIYGILWRHLSIVSVSIHRLLYMDITHFLSIRCFHI